jgi:hypothetical protein
MFDKTREKIGRKVSEPIKNVALTALLALVFSIVAIFIAVSKVA